MTARHPMDCYLTPPCAARAIGMWLASPSIDAWRAWRMRWSARWPKERDDDGEAEEARPG